ncbi:MAG: N-acetylglucosamine/diacetylchitobiose ABC transporter substrate-binding protein [Thermomicrobiales bacterium]|nr:N-acetylglucosamine/diacetylchitobiose ABC transporter substrate-binding protein [Thermomicrobiales bacterium]
MSDKVVTQLVDEAVRRHYTRRDIVRRGAALGLSAPAIGMALNAARPLPAFAQDASNPLGVDPAAGLEVVIFDGGFGNEYAVNVNTMYNALYPDAEITYTATIRLGPQFQPRFVAGNPPDVMDNSGAENLPIATLVAEGQLADLADLLTAPAYDTESSTFIDTLVPGSQETGVFSGTQNVLLYAMTVYGIWYDQTWFAEQGYTYPTTWADMMSLCEDIKAQGIAPWTYQGQYPQYMRLLFDQMVPKQGGLEALVALDNLEDGAWLSEPVVAAASALRQLYDNGYILEGTEALSHTDSQAAWLQGQAAFIPCGTWLENEMSDLIPEDFVMVVNPSPSLEGDVVPFEGVGAWAGENFHVSEQGKNVQGGKEWLRLLFSKEGARFFSENTKAPTVVVGAADGLDLGVPFQSAADAIANAGDYTFASRYADWYPQLSTDSRDQFGRMMTGQASVEEALQAIQETADAVKADDSIPKYTREI